MLAPHAATPITQPKSPTSFLKRLTTKRKLRKNGVNVWASVNTTNVYVLPRARYKCAVAFARELATHLRSAKVSDEPADRLLYGRDLWPRRLIEARDGRPATSPKAIVWPGCADDVSKLVDYAKARGIVLVPYGAGSGVCGAVKPTADSIVVDLKRMNRIVIDQEAPCVDVEAGTLGITLEDSLGRLGYTTGHYPSSILCSTVGGWIAARGAGQCSGLYGKIEDMVFSASAVLGTGQALTAYRRRSAPSVLPLLIGSEGTLGIVTSARLRLHPLPRTRSFLAFSFARIEQGWDAVRQLYQSGLRPAVARLYDPVDSALMKQDDRREHPPSMGGESRMKELSRLLRVALRVPTWVSHTIGLVERAALLRSTLILVFEGARDETTNDAKLARELCEAAGGHFAGEAPAKQWFLHRYSVSYRQSPVFHAGAFSDTMEVAATWSKLADVYHAVREALGRYVVVMAHLSHAYPDGCSIYFTFAAKTRTDSEALSRYDQAWRAGLRAALDNGATLSHHHGVGRSKAPRLYAELGFGVEVVRRLMRACDPHSILNIGNLVPQEPWDAARASAQRLGQPTPAGGSLALDALSGLVTLAGKSLLKDAERELTTQGFSLGLSEWDEEQTVNDWIAGGLGGARNPWEDPVSRPVSGLCATLHTGQSFCVPEAPRRAVGPDLSALLCGAQASLATVKSATVTAHRLGAERARTLRCGLDPDPVPTSDEQSTWQRITSCVLKPEDQAKAGSPSF